MKINAGLGDVRRIHCFFGFERQFAVAWSEGETMIFVQSFRRYVHVLIITCTFLPDSNPYDHANMSVKCIPLTSHFYIVKVGFTGVFIIFLFLL